MDVRNNFVLIIQKTDACMNICYFSLLFAAKIFRKNPHLDYIS